MEIIKDIEKLRVAAEPLKFIDKNVVDKTEGTDIINKLRDVMNENKAILALTAPQIGIKKRIFGIRFEDQLKFFIDPVIIKKSGLSIAPETFVGMDNKEILIGRPDEITAVYYTQDFKYEENKFIKEAARIFDQSMQVLDGILPDVLGLVSDITKVGSLAELNKDEIAEVIDFYKEYVNRKLAAIEKYLKGGKDLDKEYRLLNFSENVINGRTKVISDEPDQIAKKAQEIENRSKIALSKFKKMQNDSQLRDLATRSQRKGRHR